ncbi:hypothetical protein M8C21_010048 [Ambrosia artemisiifolia]|uniref:F-box domain-containing protein n=1 Tax=Ambrosia artemisiifolia TaxID=4212 RepID=A0AAD5G8E6_AMBAR|nr:hypothetical protein M8C21_010048 [Ambrosia artemisiifolia]
MATSRTTVDDLSIELIRNILTRLHSVDFASADCVSRSWNRACCGVAVEDVVNKVLSELIRPHFVIASVGPCVDLQEAHRLITARLSSKIPVVVSSSFGVIGRDVNSDEFKESRWLAGDDAERGIVLTIGFVPWMKVKSISLPQQIGEDCFKVDKFIKDIWEFSASISGHYAMSPETVIVGGGCCNLQHASGSLRSIGAIALVFAEDINKPPDSTTAISSAANASAYLRSFKQGSTNAGDKRQVFGGLIFSSWSRGGMDNEAASSIDADIWDSAVAISPVEEDDDY